MSQDFYLDQVKKCMTFVFDLSEEPIGTGFFVSIKLEIGGYAIYFVTAKHVVQDRSGKYRDNIFIRLNLIKGSSELIRLPLTYVPNYILTYDKDENIDLVAYLINPPQDRYDYLHIPQDYFTDTKILQDKNIREGSNAFFAGLFYKFAKNERNHPVIRFGKIGVDQSTISRDIRALRELSQQFVYDLAISLKPNLLSPINRL